jgi:ADP-heptose:LPS heptosyltransferase
VEIRGDDLREAAKRLAFSGVAAMERMARAFSGGSPSLDPAELVRIRHFILPFFDPYLGALVHETPLVAALRTAMPDAKLVAAAGPLAWEVFQHHPGLDRIEPIADPNKEFRRSVDGLRRLVKLFHGERWCALFAAWNSRSRVALAAILSGNGLRAGFAVAPQLLHLPIPYDRLQSQIANNLRIPRALGHSTPNTLEPRIYFAPEDVAKARALLSVNEPLHYKPMAILVTQTNPEQPKKWRSERFVETAHWLTREHGARIVLPGTAREAAAVSELRNRIGGDCLNVAGMTSIPVLSAIMAHADLVLTLDSGILHVARSQATPTCIIAPAWSPVHEWLPLGNPRFRILRKLDLPAAPPDYFIDEVSVEDVRSSLNELLAEFPPSEASRQARVHRSSAAELDRVHSL